MFAGKHDGRIIAHALVDDIDAVHHVAQAIERAAVRHQQAIRADRCHAAGQQIGVARHRAKGVLAQRDLAQRRAQHAALVHRGGAQLQRAEHRVRQGRQRRGRVAAALDGQPAGRVELGRQLPIFVDHVAFAHFHLARGAAHRIDLRARQGQVARRVQRGRRAHADVAARAQRQLAKGVALDHQVVGHVLRDHAVAADIDGIAQVDQRGMQGQAGVVVHVGHAQLAGTDAAVARAAHGIGHQVVVALGAAGAGQADVGRRQLDLRAGGGVGMVGQGQGAGRQAQALPQRQVEVAIKTDQAVRQQGQVVEAAGGHAVRAQLCHTVAQRRIAVAHLQVGSQTAIALDAGNNHFTRHAHRVFHRQALQVELADDAVVRRFQVERQGAAGRAGPAGGRMHATVEQQATEGAQRDAAAVASHQHAALARQIELGGGTGRFQARAGAHDDEGVGRLDLGGVEIVPGANFDAATSAHMAIHAALGVDGGGRAAGHVEDRALTDPDRLGVGAAIRTVDFTTGHQRARQHGNAAAGRAQRTVHGDLAVARQADALAVVHAQRGALAHHQRRLGVAGAGRQCDIGAGALLEHAFHGIFLPQRRQPRLQHGGRIGAGRQLVRQRQVGAQQWHGNVDAGALRHLQALLAIDVVVRKAALEQRVVQHQQRLDGQILRRMVAGQQAIARIQGHVERERGAGSHPGVESGYRHAVREGVGRHQVARTELAAHARQGDAGRHGHAAGVADAVAAGDGDVFIADRGGRHHPGGRQGVRARRAEVRQVQQRLAGLDLRADIAEVAIEHGAGLDGEGFCQRQVHGYGLACWQHAIVRQHAAAQRHAGTAVDGQGAAAVGAVAAQFAIEHQRLRLDAVDIVLVRAQGDVAAAPAFQRAVGQHGRARGRVDRAAGRQVDAAAADQRHRAAVDMRQAGCIARIQLELAPQAARVERHAGGHIDAHLGSGRWRGDRGIEPAAGGVGLLADDVAQRDAAAARRQPGVDRDLRRMQRDLAARRDLHGGIDLDVAAGIGLDAAQFLRIEPARVQVGLAEQILGQGIFALELTGADAAAADMDGLQQRRGIVA
ncbi:hypothetical protein D3C81_275680 [compost metagenome]